MLLLTLKMENGSTSLTNVKIDSKETKVTCHELDKYRRSQNKAERKMGV